MHPSHRKYFFVLEIFRQNHFLNSLLLFPYSLLLAIDGFFLTREIGFDGASPMFEMTFSWLEGRPLLNVIFTAFILFINAALINRLVIGHRLSRAITLFPGLAYLLLMNALPSVRGMHGVIVANFMAILFLLNCFPIIRLYNTEKIIFNMGSWCALAGLFFPGYFMLIILIFISIAILRSFSLKEIGQSLTGFFSIIIIAGTVFYVRDDMSGFWTSLGSLKFSNWLKIFSFADYFNALIVVVTFLLVIIAIFNFYKLMAKQTIKEQKKIKLTYWFMALMFPAMILIPQIERFAVLVLAIPLSIILGIVMANWKLKLAAEFIHIMVVVGILYLHFQ